MNNRYELCAVGPDGHEDIASWHPTEDDARKSARERADGRVYIVRDSHDDRRPLGESIYAAAGVIATEPGVIAADADERIAEPDPLTETQIAETPTGG